MCEDEDEPKVRRSQNTEIYHLPNLLKRGQLATTQYPNFLTTIEHWNHLIPSRTQQ
ncbi:hypothetical protein METHPM2_3500001 [Pseudomonas sp. PM2]